MALHAPRGVALLLLSLAGLAAAPPARQEASRPNFLVVLVDDWSLEDFEAARSDDETRNDLPVIEALAAGGQVWRHFYSQPVCNPSRCTLLFGRATGETLPGACLPPGEATPPAGTPTLASLLRDAGYATAAFGKWHVATHPDPDEPRERAPAAYGFDAWRAWSASNLAGNCGSKDYLDWYRVDDGVGKPTHEYHTSAVAAAFEQWWTETQGPRLAYVGFQAPHQPLHRPPAALLPRGYPETNTRRELYDAMLVAMDTALGEMLACVDPADTFVLCLADNGTEPAAARDDVQDRSRLKGSTHQGGVNVPFIVSGPGVGPGRTEALGHIVDLVATLTELAQVRVPPGVAPDSVSLASVLFDPEARPRDHVVCDFVEPARKVRRQRIPLPRVRDTAVLLRDDESGHLFKARWITDLDGGGTRKQLFDLSLDPGETQVLPGEGAVYEELRRIRRAYLER